MQETHEMVGTLRFAHPTFADDYGVGSRPSSHLAKVTRGVT
jgi:hypothetical protein